LESTFHVPVAAEAEETAINELAASARTGRSVDFGFIERSLQVLPLGYEVCLRFGVMVRYREQVIQFSVFRKEIGES
jgi:hypothetical protein